MKAEHSRESAAYRRVFSSVGHVRHSQAARPMAREQSRARRSFRVRVRKITSSHEQDLSRATLLCRCLSLGRFTEWQFQANRDY
jgi:hypothetical protein